MQQRGTATHASYGSRTGVRTRGRLYGETASRDAPVVWHPTRTSLGCQEPRHWLQACVTLLDMPTVGGFGRLRGKPGLRRKFALLLGWLAWIGVGGGTTLWAYHIWTKSAYQPEVADVFSLASLVITFLAAAVALLAYQVATGLPDLILLIWFNDGQPDSYNMHIKTSSERWAELGNWFNADNDYSIPKLGKDDDGWRKIAYISIRNKSKYAARNPAVVVRFGDVDKPILGLCKSWKTRDDLLWKDTSLTSSGVVVTETQWDGDYPIHGFSTRRLPDLPLVTLYSKYPERPAKFHIDLLADGYRKVETITMNFAVEPCAGHGCPLKPRSRRWPRAGRPRRTGHGTDD